MRSITIIIALMAISLQLYSQDIVDPPKLGFFTVPENDTMIIRNFDTLKQAFNYF